MHRGSFTTVGRLGVNLVCATLLSAGYGGISQAKAQLGNDAGGTQADGLGSSGVAGARSPMEQSRQRGFEVIGAIDTPWVTPAELDALWKLAQSSRADRIQALRNYLANPAAARRFVRRYANITRAAVGLDNELRMQIAEELIVPGVAPLPQDPGRRAALLRLGAELQLGGEVPGLAELAIRDLLRKLTRSTDTDEIDDLVEVLMRVAESVPEDKAYDLLVQTCSVELSSNPRLAREWPEMPRGFAERLPAVVARPVIDEWLADPATAEQRFHPAVIAACADKMSEELACKLIDQLPEADSDDARQKLIRRLRSAAIERVSPEFGRTLASRLVNEIETAADEQHRTDLAIQLGRIPGRLLPEVAVRALASVEPQIKRNRPSSQRVDLPAVEAIAKRLSPEAISVVIPIFGQWIAKAREENDRPLARMLQFFVREACKNVTPETALPVATALDTANEPDQHIVWPYAPVIAKLPREKALAYARHLRGTDQIGFFCAVAQGLAESPVALTAPQRMILVDLILERATQNRGPSNEFLTIYGQPLGVACKGLSEEDRTSVIAQLLEPLRASRSAGEREIVAAGLAAMAGEMSVEQAKPVIAALAEADAKSAYHLSSALEARPPGESGTHLPSILTAVSQCKPGAKNELARIMRGLIEEIPHDEASHHADLLVELMAKGAIGWGAEFRLEMLSAGLSQLLPKLSVEQRAVLATKAAGAIGSLYQDYSEKLKPNVILRDAHHPSAAAQIVKPFGGTSKDIPAPAAKQFATTLLAFMEKAPHPGFDLMYLADALPGVVDNLAPAEVTAVTAHIAKVMERAGPTEEAHLRDWDPQIIGPLCAALFRIPGTLDEVTAKRVVEAMVGSIEDTHESRMPCLTAAMVVVGDELTDSQLCAIVQAALKKSKERRRSVEPLPLGPLLQASICSLSADGAKQAWPTIIDSIQDIESPQVRTAIGQCAVSVAQKLPPAMASELIEAIKDAKDEYVVSVAVRGLGAMAAKHPEVKSVLDKEIANTQDPEKQRLRQWAAEGALVQQYDFADAEVGDSHEALLSQLNTATKPSAITRMLSQLIHRGEGLDPPQLVALVKYPTMVGQAEKLLINELRRKTGEPDTGKPIEGLWDLVARAQEFSLVKEVHRAPAKLSAR